MKSKVLTLLFTILSFHAFSQLEIGVKGSLLYSNLNVNNLQSVNIKTVEVDNDFGFRAGFNAKINIVKVFIQPELLFTQLNSHLKVMNYNNEERVYKFLLHRLDVPLYIGAEIKNFKFFGGPVATFNLNSAAPIFKNQGNTNPYNQGSWALAAGVGYLIKNLEISIHYENAVSDYANEIEVNIGEEVYQVPLRFLNSSFGITVGYFF